MLHRHCRSVNTLEDPSVFTEGPTLTGTPSVSVQLDTDTPTHWLCQTVCFYSYLLKKKAKWMPVIEIYFAFIDVCGLIIYEPIYISHSRLYKKPAQLKSSNHARFNIYCKGKCFMNNGAIRFKKYWTLDFPWHPHEKSYKWPIPKTEVQMRPKLAKGSSGEAEVFCTHTS